ncbi:FG-GAP-like repeat-containing protein [Nitrospira sp. MA-1]|nr:FG-GAP-like repeat-containing protein [Nitrospira sp. MA-1]
MNNRAIKFSAKPTNSAFIAGLVSLLGMLFNLGWTNTAGGETDLNGDGRADLVWRNTSTGATGLWLMNGTTIEATAFPGGVPLAWQIAGVGDVTGDGQADVIWRNSNSGTMAIWVMNGLSITRTGFPGTTSIDWTIQGVGDLDGNGRADLVWRNTSTGATALWLMNGTTIGNIAFPGAMPLAWQIAGVGDVTGDGQADVIWRDSNSGSMAIWVMNGLSITRTGFPGTTSIDWTIQGVGDLDGNGRADLVWRNTSTGATALWLMNGTTIGNIAFPGGVPLAWQIVGVGDVTGNGQVDVIWRNSNSGTMAVWVMNGLTIARVGFPGSAPTDWIISGRGDVPSTIIQTGTVSGQVTSSANGEVVAGAIIRTTAGNTTSAADGRFTVAAGIGERIVVHVEATGFAEAFPVVRVSAGQMTNLGVRLLPTGVIASMAVANGASVTIPNSTAQVPIPPNGLVPRSGGASAGTVNVAVTPINPALDINLMPGDFRGVSARNGSQVPIESFGAMLIDVRDATGTRYNLAPGMTSTIRIPVGTLSPTLPPTIPLFFFDENTGLWIEEGTAELQGLAPNHYYEGTVRRISYWNAGLIFETVVAEGCVHNAANQPVPNVLVQTLGINYSGAASVRTAADGTFRVPLRRDSTAVLIALDGTRLSSTLAIGPSSTNFPLSPCLILTSPTNGLSIKLTWGAQPSDLDSHIFSPNGDHVYFANKGSFGTLPFARLDVDDRTGFGPEVITIARLMKGTYQYLVHNFSGSFNPGMIGSPARVELTRDGASTVYVPPSGEGTTRYWHVFNILVDAQCLVSIVPVNRWESAPSRPSVSPPTLCPAN